ncbi:MAG: hypothetical protein JWN72_1968, partial [Thermoleophilia bacterium]|nr:hypothetical protein [Thermoleophilia bacterium]
PDGSMYFAGYDASRAMVTKVLPTGALDTSFGGGDGVVDVLAPGSTASFAYALEVQPDGSILMGGYATRANNDLLIVRFLADGSLDTSFGVGGYVVDSITSSTDLVYAITADVAGNVIVSGSYTNGPGFDGVVVRYLPNGTRDTTFGTNGFVATGTPAYDERFTQVEIDSTGRIVVSSTIADQTWSGTGATWRDMSVRRYLATGQPDAAFGTAGLVTLNRSALTDYVMGLTIDHLDRPVIVGYTNVSTSMRGVVARLRETDGALDPTFATGGWYDHDPTTYNDYLYDVHELDDGSIAAVGTTPPDGAQFSTGVLRLTTAGVLQSATVVDLLPTSENIRGSSLDGDGGLVVAGYTTTAPLVAVIGHLAGASFTDYGTAAANTWQGGAASLFGTCLRSLAGASVSAPWSIDGNAACTAFDTDPWRAVARQPSEVAATTVAGASATANFRFGLRTSASQKPGAYASMVTFNVVAP